MKLLTKERFIPHQPTGGVFPGFITYISNDKPILMHRHGWVDASDTYDKFADAISTDNGQTWSPYVMALEKTTVPQGEYRYAENTCFFDEKTGVLHTLTTHALYGHDHKIVTNKWCLQINTYDTKTQRWGTPWRSDFGIPQGLMLSFSFPLETREGTIIVPCQARRQDEQGNPIFTDDYWAPHNQALVLRGQRQHDGSIQWQPGNPVTIDPNLSSRGIYEPAVAQLLDGSLVMTCRGDNGYFPEKPGHKWVSRSTDQGQNWTDPVPLTLADGGLIESSSTGNTLFRSIKNGKLYWMGNLCIEGERPKGNWPRHPLVLAQVQEEPFGLMPETFTVIDTKQPGEDKVQMSNFRYYQDRETGDLVIFLTRFGENHPQSFKMADYYRYRVQMDR